MTTTEIIQIGSFLFAGVSVYVSLSIYRRSRNREYLTHLYRAKLEAFSGIAFEMQKLLHFYAAVLLVLENHKQESDDESLEKLNKLESNIDDFVREFSNKIVMYSVPFPEHIVELLFDISISQFADNVESDLKIDETILIIKKVMAEQTPLFNRVYDEIREDLKLSKMNEKLFK